MGLGGVAIAVPPYVIHPKNGRSRTGWGGCSILGIFPNIRRKLGFFMQNQLGNWLKTAKN